MQVRQMKIIPGAPTAAIYTRKSRATEKGESIEHQISKCIALCESKGWGYIVYVDYDFSGKDTDRPDFHEMMKKVRNNEFDYVVVYHIYRFARNMKDFAIIIDELFSIDVGFVSISQNFDTSTPMGRAALYITAVLGQAEREDRALEVRDNMIYLASIGRWNGGPVPFGFDTITKVLDYRDGIGMKEVTYLIINENESRNITEFFDWYRETDGSVRNNTTKANELGYKTKTYTTRTHNFKEGASWGHNQMSRILQNPLYCIADEDSYDYFKNHTKVNIISEGINPKKWDGSYGIMLYNQRRPYKNTTRLNPESEWIISVGEHKGFIPGKIFAETQMKLKKNKTQAPRTGQSLRSPLVGLVKCARCGSSMSIFCSQKSSDKAKGYYHYFRCITREQKAKILCDNSNVRADLLEDLVLTHITGLLDNENALQSILEATNESTEDNRVPLEAKQRKIKNELKSLDNELDNLVEALSKNILPELVIKRKYKDLEAKKIELRNELEKINIELSNNYVETYDLETVTRFIRDFKNTYEYLDIDEKKTLLKLIIKEISVDRNKIKLTLFFLPGQEYDSQADCLCMDKGSYLR